MLKTSLANIDHRQLTIDASFRHRKQTENNAHLAQLRKTLRNTGRLDPILVWREQDKEGKETGRLILLDGHFRVTAYRAEAAEGNIDGKGIPALLGTGTRLEAELEALRANTKDCLPLTPNERTDAAWALVRRYQMEISKSELAKASGVSACQVASAREAGGWHMASIPQRDLCMIERNTCTGPRF